VAVSCNALNYPHRDDQTASQQQTRDHSTARSTWKSFLRALRTGSRTEIPITPQPGYWLICFHTCLPARRYRLEFLKLIIFHFCRLGIVFWSVYCFGNPARIPFWSSASPKAPLNFTLAKASDLANPYSNNHNFAISFFREIECFSTEGAILQFWLPLRLVCVFANEAFSAVDDVEGWIAARIKWGLRALSEDLRILGWITKFGLRGKFVYWTER